jgi:hypothetical protein
LSLAHFGFKGGKKLTPLSIRFRNHNLKESLSPEGRKQLETFSHYDQQILFDAMAKGDKQIEVIDGWLQSDHNGKDAHYVFREIVINENMIL